MSKKLAFLAAGILMIVIGVGLFVWENTPEGVCAPEGATRTSGFVDKEKGCALTIESYQAIRDSKTGLQWDNIGGALLVLGGLGLSITGLVIRRKPAADARVTGSATGP